MSDLRGGAAHRGTHRIALGSSASLSSKQCWPPTLNRSGRALRERPQSCRPRAGTIMYAASSVGASWIPGSPAASNLLSFQQRQRQRQRKHHQKKLRGPLGLGFHSPGPAAMSKSPPSTPYAAASYSLVATERAVKRHMWRHRRPAVGPPPRVLCSPSAIIPRLTARQDCRRSAHHRPTSCQDMPRRSICQQANHMSRSNAASPFSMTRC